MDHYNQSVILDSKEKLDERSINSIFRKLLEHHDVLRSVFRIKDGRYFQNISEKVKEVIVRITSYNVCYTKLLRFIQKQKKEELLKYWKEHLIITEPCRLSDISYNFV